VPLKTLLFWLIVSIQK